MGWREYIALRAARLLPLHILVSLPFAAVLLANGTFDPVQYAINAALLQSWVPSSDVYFSFNALSWSLSNEAFFYALLPVLVGLTAVARVRFLVRLLLIVAASATIFTLFLDGRIAFGERPLTNWVFYIFPVFRLVEFVAGLVIFDLWSRGVFSRWRLTLVAIPALIGAMAVAPYVPDAFRVSLFFLPFAVLLLVSHLSDRPSYLGRLFSSRLMQRLGEASFAFYLVHWMVLLVVQRFAGTVKEFVDSDLLLGAASYVLAALIAVALHLGFEKPVERRLKAAIHARFGRLAPRRLESRVV